MAIAELELSSCVERIVRLHGNPIPDEVAAACGCEPEAVVGLHPCLVNGRFLAVLAPISSGTLPMQLLEALDARTVASLPAQTVLLGAVMASEPPRVLADARILEHDEIVFCVEPPGGYGVSSPARLIEALRAEPIAR